MDSEPVYQGQEINYVEDQMDQYLSVKELTGLLGVSRATIYRLKSKGLPFLKVGKLTRFPRDRVISWLEGQRSSREAEEIILQVGDYRCLGCGWVGHVERPRPLKEIFCPQCGTRSRVELVKGP